LKSTLNLDHVNADCLELGVRDIEIDVWALNSGVYEFFEKSGLKNRGLR